MLQSYLYEQTAPRKNQAQEKLTEHYRDRSNSRDGSKPTT